MRVRRLKEAGCDLVRLQLPKGVLAVLTVSEYLRALRRGKMEKRAARLAARLVQDAHAVSDERR